MFFIKVFSYLFILIPNIKKTNFSPLIFLPHLPKYSDNREFLPFFLPSWRLISSVEAAVASRQRDYGERAARGSSERMRGAGEQHCRGERAARCSRSGRIRNRSKAQSREIIFH
jgi:hypothetical protein